MSNSFFVLTWKVPKDTIIIKEAALNLQIWSYKGTNKIANIALGHVIADVSSSHGLMERDILVSVGANGLLW